MRFLHPPIRLRPSGLILIPFYGTIAALIGCAVVYVGFVAVDVLAGQLAWGSARVLTAPGFVAFAVLFGGAVRAGDRNALAIAENPQSPPEVLMSVSQRWISLWRVDVFVALAKNPATPAPLLAAMAAQNESKSRCRWSRPIPVRRWRRWKNCRRFAQL